MTVAELVQGLRKRLGESTKDFAARWHCSPRTVEDWEQGRSEPSAFVVEAMRGLAKSLKGTKKKQAKGKG